ncbi:MAG TPA: D-alanyl-D-alanine carboxypeptidase/D-alanyl-D-alanine-endopeptidase [Acidimicrobiia bacterium]
MTVGYRAHHALLHVTPLTRRITAGTLVLGAILTLALAFSGDGGPTAGAPTTSATPIATPMWSARRVPQPIVDAVGAQHLQAALDASVPADGTCFLLATGSSTLAVHNPDVPLIGASTQKILVAAAALATLGRDFTYQTRAVAPAAPVGGSVERLWLVGAGDPVLATADYAAFVQAKDKTRGDVTTGLETLADAIVSRGVRQIPGGVVADDSRYDTQRYVPTWKASYRTDGNIGPMGALTVNDGWRAWDPRKITVDDPGLYSATELTALLKTRGVVVGSASRGAAPSSALEIAQVTSPKLGDIVASMLRSSDNLTAELLTKELGARANGKGTTVDGVKAIMAEVKQLGVPTDNLTLIDGSGLDRGNRTTCRILLSALALVDRRDHAVFQDGLPVAGQTGTLVDEFSGTALVGKLRGKTGTLDGVSGVTGVIDLGGPVSFAFIENGNFPEAAAAGIRVRFGGVIATYPDAPGATDLVPAPG